MVINIENYMKTMKKEQGNNKVKQNKVVSPQKQKETSWESVSSWYDEYLQSDDTFQSKVILPNLVRILDLKTSERVLDLACGQGFFSKIFADLGAMVTGVDISASLIDKAKKSKQQQKSSLIAYHVSESHRLGMIGDKTQDTIVVVLAFENISKINETLAECARVLKQNGRMVIVLMHPAFRIPRDSDWEYSNDKKVQRRIISRYMSEITYEIVMNPGAPKNKQIKTLSFHRPLQWYMKAFRKAGFGIVRLEEWISHRESGVGPQKEIEDIARKEIPVFMCLELSKFD
jgi:ubiquinone/menaquinone biosynthesis C-methylase UbiE